MCEADSGCVPKGCEEDIHGRYGCGYFRLNIYHYKVVLSERSVNRYRQYVISIHSSLLLYAHLPHPVNVEGNKIWTHYLRHLGIA
ncbi:unnamed protein product [Gongylonema pulchrum]|uniref:Ovule protein n=1 Tax=Gongylonema pulchrum TaxID=637853 RepID=A0A183CV44_9BILA|nr:unnamed protein product [Gongylonema pulchrum]